MSLDDAIARRRAQDQHEADAEAVDAATFADWRRQTKRLFDDFFARMAAAGYPGTTTFKDYRGGRGGGSHADWSVRRRLSASWHSARPKRVKGWVLSGNEMLSVDGLIYWRTGHPDGVNRPGQDPLKRWGQGRPDTLHSPGSLASQLANILVESGISGKRR